jgi:hypothetical protein
VQEKARDAKDTLQGGSKSAVAKVLVPLSAALTSAAVSYAVRKLPKLLEQHVLPKLKEQGNPRDVASDVMQRVRDVVESHTPVGDSGGSRDEGSRRQRLSGAQRERERAERAARRRRRKESAARR